MGKRIPPYRDLETKIAKVEELLCKLKTRRLRAPLERRILPARLRQAERNLKMSRIMIRTLAGQTEAVRVNERTAIARELHDEFGQALTGLVLGLSWISRSLTAEQQPIQERIASLADIVKSMMRSVRNVANELRIGPLNKLGLVKTLKSEAKGFEERTGIPCTFETNAAKFHFGRAAAAAIFRIVQGALTNVARHAQASRVEIVLMKKTNCIILTVADDGKGIPRNIVFAKSSLGITGMQERAAAFGGTLKLHDTPGKGTTLRLRIPQSKAVARS
jgi:signal transduction histidine kinase